MVGIAAIGQHLGQVHGTIPGKIPEINEINGDESKIPFIPVYTCTPEGYRDDVACGAYLPRWGGTGECPRWI